MFKNLKKKLKKYVSEKTFPEDAVIIYGDVYVECYPTLYAFNRGEFVYDFQHKGCWEDENEVRFNHKYIKFTQTKMGKWVPTTEFLYTDTNYGGK